MYPGHAVRGGVLGCMGACLWGVFRVCWDEEGWCCGVLVSGGGLFVGALVMEGRSSLSSPRLTFDGTLLWCIVW